MYCLKDFLSAFNYKNSEVGIVWNIKLQSTTVKKIIQELPVGSFGLVCKYVVLPEYKLTNDF